jgi:hypothetical protein
MPALLFDLLGSGSGWSRASVEHLGLRWLTLAAGLLGLALLTRRQRHWAPVLAGVVTALVFAYGGVYLPGGADFQPYRYLFQAALWATLGVPAALALARRVIPAHGSVPRFVACAVAVPLALWLAIGLRDARPELLGGDARAWHGPSDATWALCEFLRSEHDGGRVLVDDWRLGAVLPACAGVEVIGGPFMYMAIEHGYANATHWSFLGGSYQEQPTAQLQRELAVYDVRYFVTNHELPVDWYTLRDRLRNEPELAEPIATFGA